MGEEDKEGRRRGKGKGGGGEERERGGGEEKKDEEEEEEGTEGGVIKIKVVHQSIFLLSVLHSIVSYIIIQGNMSWGLDPSQRFNVRG